MGKKQFLKPRPNGAVQAMDSQQLERVRRQFNTQAKLRETIIQAREAQKAIDYINALTVPALRLVQLIERARTAIRCAVDLEKELTGMPGQLAGALTELIIAYELVDESLAQRNPKLLRFATQLIAGIAEYRKAVAKDKNATIQSRADLQTLTARDDDPVSPFAQEPSGQCGLDVIGQWLADYRDTHTYREAVELMVRTFESDDKTLTDGQSEALYQATRRLNRDHKDTFRKWAERTYERHKKKTPSRSPSRNS